VRKLSIAPKGRHWSMPLRRGMVKISEEDFRIIEEHLK